MRKISVAAFAAILLLMTACSKPASTDQSADDSSNPTSTSNSKEARYRSEHHEGHEAEERRIVIPSGTSITVRLGDALSTKSVSAGQGFSATVAEAVDVNGKTAIPEGATAEGTVVDAGEAGRFKGAGGIALRLASVTVNGHRYPVETDEWVKTVKSRGKRTLIGAGAGAGLGALIGGLAGGGKGAAIGAGAGGGAGTAGAAFTGKRDVTLPAETALVFRLTHSLDVE